MAATRFSMAAPATCPTASPTCRTPRPPRRPTRPTIPVAGFYPVYTWVAAGSEPDQPALPHPAYRRRSPGARAASHGRQRLGLPGHLLLQRRLEFGQWRGRHQRSWPRARRYGRGHRRRHSLRQRHGFDRPGQRHLHLPARGGSHALLGAEFARARADRATFTTSRAAPTKRTISAPRRAWRGR